MRLMSFLLVIFFSFSSWGFVKSRDLSNPIVIYKKAPPTVDSGIILKTQQQQAIENRLPAQVNLIPSRPYPDGEVGEWKVLRKASRP